MEPIKGLIRLSAAWLAGILFTWLSGVAAFIGQSALDEQLQLALVEIVTLLLSGAYYYGINLLQPKIRLLGYGLFIPKTPVYVDPVNAKDARHIIRLKRL